MKNEKKIHLDINKQKQWLGRAHMWVHGCVFEWVSEGIANTTHHTQQAEVFVCKLAKMFFMLIIRCYSIHCILSGYWEIDHIYTWFHFPCRNRIHGNFPIDLIVMHTHPICVCVICRVSCVLSCLCFRESHLMRANEQRRSMLIMCISKLYFNWSDFRSNVISYNDHELCI